MSQHDKYRDRYRKESIKVECSKWIRDNGMEQLANMLFAKRSIEKFRAGLRSAAAHPGSPLASLCTKDNLFSSYLGAEFYCITTARRCWVGHISELTAEQQKYLTAFHENTSNLCGVEIHPDDLRE